MNLYVMFGIPGSGKSTWANNLAARTTALLATTDPTRTHNVNTVSQLNNMADEVEAAIQDGHDVVIDACNLHTALRRRWLRLGHRTGAHCVLVVMQTPHQTSIRRNLQRPTHQRVPSERMVRYVNTWDTALRAAQREPWHDIRTAEHDTGRRW